MRSILALFLLLSQCDTCNAHGGGAALRSGERAALRSGEGEILREMATSERSVITSASKTKIEHSSAFLSEIRSSTRGLKEHKVRISNFYKKYKSDFKDFGEEIILNEFQEGTDVAIQINEIQNNPDFNNLKSALSKKLKLKNLSKYEVILILLGQKVHSYQISDANLYKIYFSMSHSFAKTELERFLDESECGSDASKKIILYAKKRNIPLKLRKCDEKKEPQEEGDVLDFIVGLIFIIGFAYIIYKIFQKIKGFVQNLGKRN